MRKKVLIVDDNATVRMAIREMLLHMGFDVVEAENGAKGFARFMDMHSDLALVLTDVGLGDINGLELQAKIKKERSDMPVILMSVRGASIPASREKNFLAKPFTYSELQQHIDAA